MKTTSIPLLILLAVSSGLIAGPPASSGIDDLDKIRAKVRKHPTNAANLQSRKAAVYRWWRFLWHQGYDMNGEEGNMIIWENLLSSAGNDRVAFQSVDNAYAALEDIMANGTMIPKVAGISNQAESMTKTNWPVYHGTNGHQTGYSPDPGPSKDASRGKSPKAIFGMRNQSSKTAESMSLLPGQMSLPIALTNGAAK